ncbi:MAG: hypothetical protein IKW24_02615 [Clostridia bacterium]|nr:hypothetical protein [Clostridia bacterium]
MKIRYFALILAVSLFGACLGGCGFGPYMTTEQLEQYQMFDPNVIWEKGNTVLQGFNSWHDDFYCSIVDVPQSEYIGWVQKHPVILNGTWYEPRVLVHKDKGTDYELDPSSARLTLRGDYYNANTQEECMLLGGYYRDRELAAIEEEIAKQVAEQLTADISTRIDNSQIREMYEGYAKDLYAYEKNAAGTLHIEFRLREYPSLIWVGQIRQIDGDYLIAFNRVGDMNTGSYVVCNDALRELIDGVVERYGLIEWDEKALNGVDRFSYEEHKQAYPENTPGVKHDGFVNTEAYGTYTEKKALERAINEVTVEWDTSHVSYDLEAEVWLVEFSMSGVDGGTQSVYLGDNGITLMIVYGE